MKVHYLTGSRADFGLMRECLKALDADERINLSVIATGQALIKRYGNVEEEIATAGLHLAHRIPVFLSGADKAEMAFAFADEVRGLAEFWSTELPDLVLLLGDRGEMLAAAIVSFHLGVPIAHIHGGERSGTLDDGFRHAISKLANYHFVATEDARHRLEKMGEMPEAIWVVGAPGLIDTRTILPHSDSWLRSEFGLPSGGPAALMLFHPVVDEALAAFDQTSNILSALEEVGAAVVVLRPNSDAGGAAIDKCISETENAERIIVCDHLPRDTYLKVLSAVDFIIGNSSSGIIESASVGTACVNVGSRQEGRLQNQNTVNCSATSISEIVDVIGRACALRGPFENCYGEGDTHMRISELIARLPVKNTKKKINRY